MFCYLVAARFEDRLKDSITRLEILFKDRKIGNNIIYFHKINSTQTFLKHLVKSSPLISSGTIIIALEQTNGLGRTGNQWYSPIGGLWMSIYLTTNVGSSKIVYMTWATAISICQVIENMFDLPCSIKWPNDIFINNKKAAGIISDISITKDKIEHIIIGMGINLDIDISDITERFRSNYSITSIAAEYKKEVNIFKFLKYLLELLNYNIDIINDDDHVILCNYNMYLGNFLYSFNMGDKNIECKLFRVNKDETMLIYDRNSKIMTQIPCHTSLEFAN